MAQRCTENTARYAQVLYLVRSVKDMNAEALRAWKWAGCDADHVTVQLICHSFKSLPPPASAPLLVKPALSPGSLSDLRTHKDSVVLLLNKYDIHVRRRTHNTQWVQTHNIYEVYYHSSECAQMLRLQFVQRLFILRSTWVERVENFNRLNRDDRVNVSWAIWSCMDWSVSQTHKSVHASSHCSADQKVCACIYVYISPIVDYWTADCRLEHFDVAQPWAVMPRVLFYHKAHMWCEVSNQSDHLTPIKNMFYFIYCKKSNNVRKCSRLIHHVFIKQTIWDMLGPWGDSL